MIQTVTDFVLSAATVCDFIFTNNKRTCRGKAAVGIMSGKLAAGSSFGQLWNASSVWGARDGAQPSRDITARSLAKKRRGVKAGDGWAGALCLPELFDAHAEELALRDCLAA